MLTKEKIKLLFVTGSRADLGLMSSVMEAAKQDKRYEPYLAIVGHALRNKADDIINEIRRFRIKTSHGVNISQKKLDTVRGVGEIISRFGVFLDLNKDLNFLILCGDRFEILGVAICAYYMNVPFAQLFAGEKSVGGHLDDSVRHSITKLASLTFAVTEDSYNRVLNMGEEKWRVHNVGSPVVDNINKNLGNLNEIKSEFGINRKYIILTYHPITTQSEDAQFQAGSLLDALGQFDNLQIIATYPNNEYGSESIINVLKEATKNNKNFILVENLGWKKYLTLMSGCEFIIGNSSSGFIEAPLLRVPTVNVGARQEGRLKLDSIIGCGYRRDSIARAIRRALSAEFKQKCKNISLPFGGGGAGIKILDIVYKNIHNPNILRKKITF